MTGTAASMFRARDGEDVKMEVVTPADMEDDTPADPNFSNRLEHWRLVCLTSAMCGIQICYAVQIGHGSSTLIGYGLSPDKSGLAWLCGPLSGMIVQPLVGIYSDKCNSRLGRRRPFLLTGLILTVTALIMFGHADKIGALFGDDPKKGIFTVCLPLAVSSFFLLDFSIQAVQGPLRALLIDVAHESQHDLGNSYFAMMVGFGNLIGFFLGSVRLNALLPIFYGDVQALFTAAACLLSITVTLCCAVIHEAPRDPNYTSPRPQQGASFLRAFADAPRPFWRVFATQCFTWYGFFTLFVYGTVWVAANVFMGSDSQTATELQRQRWDAGVKFGNVGMALNALITVCFSSILPTLMKQTGVKPLYCLSQAVEAMCLLSALFIHGDLRQTAPSLGIKLAALAALGCTGISWAVTMTIPWSIMSKTVKRDREDQIGLFSTVFNLSQSAPQLFVSLGSKAVLQRFNNDISSVMAIGGVFAAIGAVLVYALQVNLLDHGVAYEQIDDDDSVDGEFATLQ